MSTVDPSSADPPKPRPPAALFALGHADLPREVTAEGITWRFCKLFKHDFFAATGLYEQVSPEAPDPNARPLAVLKVQRTYPFFGFPMRWLGRFIAGHEIRIYHILQGVQGIPKFLGKIGSTGFLHAFIPGTDLHRNLPLTAEFFTRLERLFADLHHRHVAYVDSNKRENILYGEGGQPWLIDFQISFELKRSPGDHFIRRWSYPFRRWVYRRFARADWYHFYKHKTRLLPSVCSPADFEKAKKRGFLHKLHRFIARPFIVVRRKVLSRYDLANTR